LTAPRENLLPDLEPEEYEALKGSIVHGFWLANPVVVDEQGDILDGHNRAKICRELGIEYPTVVMKGLSDWDKINYAVRSNVNRRHLSVAQRRQLLKRLREEYDKDLRAKAKEAQRAGGSKGGKAFPRQVQTETDLDADTHEERSREAAADASQSRFDEPVVANPKPTADRLTTLGEMLGRSRATVAKDEQILNRIDKIEVEAERQHRDDVVRLLNQPRPNLDELERAVGLRAPLPVAEEPDADRNGWVLNLAQAINNLAPALSDSEADLLFAKVANPALAIMQIGQIRGALASAKARGSK
jgi:ParB-like chromosome segregation protein Spo0J